MAKILYWGDAGCTTGFARVTHELCTRLVDLGHSVDILGLNYRGAPPEDNPYGQQNYTIHQTPENDVYGVTKLIPLIHELNPDVLIFLNDIPVLRGAFAYLAKAKEEDAFTSPPIIIYTPIDGSGLPFEWGSVASFAQSIITYTEFGRKELQRVCPGRDIQVAYHGMDHARFAPVSRCAPALIDTDYGAQIPAYSKDEIKAAMGLAGQFIILWVDRNSPRKDPAAFLKACAPFVLAHDDVSIYMHCLLSDVGGDLREFIGRFGLGGRVYMTPNLNSFVGVSDERLNTIYNLADVKVSTSQGEGAGLTNMEALACGVPVIAQDFSANAEMLGGGAHYVPPEFIWTTARGCDAAFPTLSHYKYALEAFYNDPTYGPDRGAAGRQHVSTFHWDDAVRVFQAEIEKVLA